MNAELGAALAAPVLAPFADLTVQVGAPIEVGAVGHGTRRGSRALRDMVIRAAIRDAAAASVSPGSATVNITIDLN